MPPTVTAPDAASDASSWSDLLPDAAAGRLPLIASIVFTVSVFCIALPSRWIDVMDRELDATNTIYHKAEDDHTLDFQLEPDRAIAENLLAYVYASLTFAVSNMFITPKSGRPGAQPAAQIRGLSASNSLVYRAYFTLRRASLRDLAMHMEDWHFKKDDSDAKEKVTDINFNHASREKLRNARFNCASKAASGY
ncbi:hypothetical protein FB451DRAFT_1166864 [Mycena latifolia]|nr:hypothetical protein FB451DRAFT_1166864 [Mycena latifolia]